MKRIALVLALVAGTMAYAQKPVYQCDGVYTDKPCKNGREVDIAPTRGAHSMSGTKRQSTEAVMDQFNLDVQNAQSKGFKQANDMMRCDELRRRREAIDTLGQPDSLKDERFKIREEQFKLNCKRT